MTTTTDQKASKHMALTDRLLTRLATRLQRDIAAAEARADAGENLWHADLLRLERRARRGMRLAQLLARKAD